MGHLYPQLLDARLLSREACLHVHLFQPQSAFLLEGQFLQLHLDAVGGEMMDDGIEPEFLQMQVVGIELAGCLGLVLHVILHAHAPHQQFAQLQVDGRRCGVVAAEGIQQELAVGLGAGRFPV